MRRLFAALIAALVTLASVPAVAQTALFMLGPPLTGNPFPSGVSFVTQAQPLTAPTSASLQFGSPFTVSFWVTSNALSATSDVAFLDTTGGGDTTGIFIYDFSGSTLDPGFALTGAVNPASGSDSCANSGITCTRLSWINDGARHHVVMTFDGVTERLWIDGVIRDQNTAGTFTAGSNYWLVGAANTAMTLSDYRVYTSALSNGNIAYLYRLGANNLIPSSGALTTGMAAYWPMGNCTSSGCPDSSGNGNALIFDTTPPSVAVTAPTNSATISGNAVTLTATCTDNVACVSVQFEVDGFPVGSAFTASPYTTTFDSTLLKDGTHSIVAVAFDPGGNQATSPTITVTSSNGITGTTYYVSTGGSCSDSNNGTSTATPWCSIAKVNASTFHAGDSILFGGGEAWSITTPTGTTGNMVLSGVGGPVAQNVFAWPSNGITVGNYDDGNGTACAVIAGTITGCPTFNLSGTATGGIELANISGVTLHNFRIIGSAATLATFHGASGVYVRPSSGPTFNNTVSNVEVEDISILFYNNCIGGTNTGLTLTNNYAHGSTSAQTVDNGIFVQGSCFGSGLIQGNLLQNIGAHNGSASGIFPGGSGNPILLSNGAHDFTVQFNVANTFGYNNTLCGGPAGMWTFDGVRVVIQNNESYNGQPSSFTAGCDWDGFDLDGGTSYSKLQYNYTHGNYGSGLVIFQSNNTGFPWQNNAIRYNISEKDGSTSAGGGIGISNVTNTTTKSAIYNNTIYTHAASGSSSIAYALSVNGNTDIVVENNLFINDSGNLLFGQFTSVPIANMTLDHNDYYWTTGTNHFLLQGTFYSTLAAWRTGSGQDANSLNVNPNLSGSLGSGGTCYSSGIPAGPQPCPSAYTLNTGSPLIGIGNDLTSILNGLGLDLPTQDYFGNSVPNGVGTGYNIGADGSHH